MTKLNFHTMSRQELRAYVLEHRDDEEAFQALMDKLQELPGVEITSIEQLSQIIELKRDKVDVEDARVALESAEAIGTTPLEELKRELGL
jgi:predicted component of type VI protein secretion system